MGQCRKSAKPTARRVVRFHEGQSYFHVSSLLFVRPTFLADIPEFILFRCFCSICWWNVGYQLGCTLALSAGVNSCTWSGLPCSQGLVNLKERSSGKSPYPDPSM